MTDNAVSKLLERWPGYEDQSWSQRFAELDRRYKKMQQDFAAALRSQPAPSERAAIIEECAKVAAEWNDNSPYNSRAAAIRALLPVIVSKLP